MLFATVNVSSARPRRSGSSKPVQPAKRRSQLRWSALISLAILLAFTPLAWLHAQTNLASITGTITDATGAAITNSNVVARNTATSASRSVASSATGAYSFSALPLGTYTITASASGFEASATTVELTLSGVSANLALTVGKASETVTISGASGTVALQTESADVSQSFSSAQLSLLPNTSGLSVLSIAVLGPASQPGTDEPEVGDEGFYNQTIQCREHLRPGNRAHPVPPGWSGECEPAHGHREYRRQHGGCAGRHHHPERLTGAVWPARCRQCHHPGWHELLPRFRV